MEALAGTGSNSGVPAFVFSATKEILASPRDSLESFRE
jgi:hypothetical protein